MIPALSSRTKVIIVLLALLLAVVFVLQIRGILAPFLWALVAAYLLGPVVTYLSEKGGLPRIWAVALIYALIFMGLGATARYLYPSLVEQGNLFLEDIPRLEASLIALVGPQPLGINIDGVIREFLASGRISSAHSAGSLLTNAVTLILKVFLFLVTTFYLLVDGTRLRNALRGALPPTYAAELEALGQQINCTWQGYIRGEIVLFIIMSAATAIGLTVLRVPGALFLGLMSGALELLPLVGPYTAGAIAVSVAYFNGTNPWGWGQMAYAGVVALMYFVFREAEDYLVIPNVLGRAVRLHPLVVLFAVTAGGFVGGLFGLIIAVPVAASIKEIAGYLRAKLLDLPVEFEPIAPLGAGVLDISMPGRRTNQTDTPAAEGTGPG